VAELTILVPTRGRPRSVRRQYEAFRETGAFDQGCDLVYLADESDPQLPMYKQEIGELPQSLGFQGNASVVTVLGHWKPMVAKLNIIAGGQAKISRSPLGFMGDDHLPRTENWVETILKEMRSGVSVVSGPDGLRTDDLPTWWVMDQLIVYALGRIVPANVAHMYCDNSVRDLAKGADVYRWMPDLLVEHLHPMAGKAEMDAGYATVNAPEQYQEDAAAYMLWRYRQMRADVEKVRALRG